MTSGNSRKRAVVRDEAIKILRKRTKEHSAEYCEKKKQIQLRNFFTRTIISLYKREMEYQRKILKVKKDTAA